MRGWFRRLMMGRYGVDQLTWVLLALSLAISLCGSIFQIKGLSILCWAVLVVCYPVSYTHLTLPTKLEV